MKNKCQDNTPCPMEEPRPGQYECKRCGYKMPEPQQVRKYLLIALMLCAIAMVFLLSKIISEGGV